MLAMFVVMSHLAGFKLGAHAIYGFYLISGFLMTLVLNETYDFRFKEFALNRFLRLFPTYYLILVISLVVFVLIPSYPAFQHRAWSVDTIGIKEIVGNVLIFPLEFYSKNPDMTPASFRVVPNSWSIAVELVCYFLLWLVTARGLKIAIASLVVAVAYHVAVKDLHPGYRYYPFIAAMLPFSSGAIAYFVYRKYPQLPMKPLLISSLALWILALYLYQNSYSWYINTVALFFFMISAMSLIHHYPKIDRLGKFLGDIAYPVFLCHWIVALVIANLVSMQYYLYGSIITTLLLSWGLVRLSDLIIEPYRDKVRSSVMKPS